MWNYTEWLARYITGGLFPDYYDLPVVVVDEGNDPPVVVDVTAPLFYSDWFLEINENLPTWSPVYDAQAIDSSGEFDVGITYRLAPVYDNHLFTISPEDGIVYFRQSPDYENPQDRCASNYYTLLIEASDESGNTNDKLVRLKILDVDESTPPSPPVVVIPIGIPDIDDFFIDFL